MLDPASYFSCAHRGLSPEGPGHLQAGRSQQLMVWVSDSRKQGHSEWPIRFFFLKKQTLVQ